MSWWDKVYEEAKGGADRVLEAYTEVEKAKASSHRNAEAEQVAARHTPQVEYQNTGDPVSVKIPKAQKKLVGDGGKVESKTAIDQKLVLAGIGLVVVAFGVFVAVKK